MHSSGDRKRRSLLAQALTANGLVVGISVVCLTALFLLTELATIQRQLELRAEGLTEFLASQSDFPMLVGNGPELERIAQTAVAGEDVLFVALADARGKLLVTKFRDRLGPRPVPIQEPLDPTPHTRVETCKHTGRGFIDVVRPVLSRGGDGLVDWETARPRRLGAVRLGFSLEKQRLLFNRAAVNGAGVAAFAVLLVLVLQYFQLRRLLRPLRALIEFTRRVGKGDLSQKAPVVSIDEVGDLTVAFNQMLEDLNLSRQELILLLREAQEASRLKGEFLANMSHEIRTPMNGVLGMISLALATELTAEQREYLEISKASGESLLALLSDILDLSKIEAGKLELSPVEFGLRAAVEETMKAMSLHAHQKGLELLCQIEPAVPETVFGDPVRLRQVLINLVGNAIKFTERGEVLLRVELEPGSGDQSGLRFLVADTGIGIPKDKQECIFEAFTQADGSTTRRYGGTGLGLTISARLVEMMGGRIWLESEPGGGAKFHFTAQFARAASGTALPAIEPDSLVGLPVLVADDNPVNLRIVQTLLRGWRAEAETAASGAEALAKMTQAQSSGRPFRLVITDALMPEMDGFELIRRIRQDPMLPQTAIMMLSSANLSQDAEICRRLGVTVYLTKPVTRTELLRAILKALGDAPPRQGAPVEPRQSSRSFHILVAEDNLVNQKLIERLIRKQGHEVALAADGCEVLAALERQSFDLILMDVQMPNMDGLAATASIRALEKATGAHVPILAMTAHAMKGDRETCLAAGMDGYLSKPVNPRELLNAIDHLVNATDPKPAAH